MKNNVTIRQVADAAGVARSSVSRAFTKPEMLSPATVAKVREVAAALGYAPNHTARALSTGRHGNIALIIPDVANPFFPPMIRAAQKTALRQDFCVFLGDSNEEPALEARLIERFIGQIEGLVLASSRLPAQALQDFAQRRPIVLINREVEGLTSVLIDSSSGMAEAVAALAALGHQHLLYVSGPGNSWSNSLRQEAAVQSAHAHGIRIECLPAALARYEAGQAVVDTVLASGATAVIVFDDITAHGLMMGLLARGVSIPGQISVIGCDDVLGSITNPALSSISSPTAKAGRIAVSLLWAQLNGLKVPEKKRLKTRFVRRETIGPRL